MEGVVVNEQEGERAEEEIDNRGRKWVSMEMDGGGGGGGDDDDDEGEGDQITTGQTFFGRFCHETGK
ncbi:high-temperature-induced dauer-formation protein [Aspergillus luchuensis]|uniref:High-temperature-induced dauer-formation protein n=1 Tax=Aspergillus kawachii TaxID=1069201 RepID=A0A146FPF7_ASPKA|nr:high-temperature-induced dauer-formation protein [Aspergillus luchuensis]